MTGMSRRQVDDYVMWRQFPHRLQTGCSMASSGTPGMLQCLRSKGTDFKVIRQGHNYVIFRRIPPDRARCQTSLDSLTHASGYERYIAEVQEQIHVGISLLT